MTVSHLFDYTLSYKTTQEKRATSGDGKKNNEKNYPRFIANGQEEFYLTNSE